MERTCDCCPSPAVVHETLMRDGVRTEVHLCAEHAIEHGLILPTNLGPALVVGKLVEKATQSAARAVKACPACGMTMQVLRDSGLVGCAQCFVHFDEELSGIIGRTQEGSVAHVGRQPVHAAALADRAATRNRIARELREAVTREEYERAARLRDQMLALGVDGACEAESAGGSAGSEAV